MLPPFLAEDSSIALDSGSMARIDRETDPEIVFERDQHSDLHDPKIAYRSMRDAVKHLLDEHPTPTALFIVIVCYIDALAGGGGRKKYAEFVGRYFKDLSAEIEPVVFYEKFRCGIVHEFRLANRGCAIVDEREIPGKYVHNNLRLTGDPGVYVGLNIVRFAREFLSVLDRLEREATPG